MKKQLIIISVLFVTATAFTLIKPINSTNNIRTSILHSYLVTAYNSSYYDPKYYPDTSLVFSEPFTGEKDPQNKLVLRLMNASGFPSVYGFSGSVSLDMYYQNDGFNKLFIKQFGKSLFGKHVPMSKDENGYASTFFFYSPIGIKAAFDKLYVKPNNKLEVATYQTIYNLTAKEYMRDFTKFLAHIMSQKSTLNVLGARYLKNAKANKGFRPNIEANYALEKLFPTDASRQQFPAFTNEIVADDLSTLLRRQCDGTLPTLLNCLKTVLKDYDSEALKLIKGTF
jgi:hypothetical protein